MHARRRTATLAAATLGLVAPLLAATGPAHAAGGTTYISFEDRPAVCSFISTNPLRGHYAAAKFSGPNATDGGAVLDNCGGFGITPRTGSRFLAFNASLTMANGGTPRGPQKIALPTPQKRVTIWASQSGIAVGSATFRLVGRRKANVVKTASVSTNTSAWVKLTVSAKKRFTSVTLSAPTEPDGIWLADDLTMVN